MAQGTRNNTKGERLEGLGEPGISKLRCLVSKDQTILFLRLKTSHGLPCGRVFFTIHSSACSGSPSTPIGRGESSAPRLLSGLDLDHFLVSRW